MDAESFYLFAYSSKSDLVLRLLLHFGAMGRPGRAKKAIFRTAQSPSETSIPMMSLSLSRLRSVTISSGIAENN